MTLRQQARIWIGVALVAVALLYFLSSVILPFVAAMGLAYLLDPVADKLERLGLSRLMATLAILLVAVLIILALTAVAVPPLLRQLTSFIEAFPDLVDKAQGAVMDRGGALLDKLQLDVGKIFGAEAAANVDAQKVAPGLVRIGSQWLLSAMKTLLSGGAAVINIASLMVVTPVVAFYLLLDWDRMIARIEANVPPRDRPRMHLIARDIDKALAGFVRGQSLLALFLGVWYAAGLTLVGVNYGLLIGLIGGVLSFIPYVGSLTVLVLSLIVAIAQAWPDLTLPGLAVGVFAVGQFLEGNVLSPRLVGDAMGLHPVWLIFALMAFGALFGFVGLLIGAPVAAVIGVLVRHGLAVYRDSAFFSAQAPPDAGSDAA